MGGVAVTSDCDGLATLLGLEDFDEAFDEGFEPLAGLSSFGTGFTAYLTRRPFMITYNFINSS